MPFWSHAKDLWTTPQKKSVSLPTFLFFLPVSSHIQPFSIQHYGKRLVVGKRTPKLGLFWIISGTCYIRNRHLVRAQLCWGTWRVRVKVCCVWSKVVLYHITYTKWWWCSKMMWCVCCGINSHLRIIIWAFSSRCALQTQETVADDNTDDDDKKDARQQQQQPRWGGAHW